MWRPVSFCWSWWRQRLAFILGRNRWLNMTGRKWESEAGDAPRYCQITRRMRQISPFLHLVLVISLTSFSSLILPVWRYVVGGLIIPALRMRSSSLKQQFPPLPPCLDDSELVKKKGRIFLKNPRILLAFRHNVTHLCSTRLSSRVAPYFVVPKCLQCEPILCIRRRRSSGADGLI